MRRNVEVVGGDDGGDAGSAHQFAQRGKDPFGSADIEIAGGLVGQKNPRRVGDGARNRDALLLAARKLRRPMRQAILEPEIDSNSAARVRALPF